MYKVMMDGLSIHDPSLGNTENIVMNGVVNRQVNHADSFKFTIYPNNVGYSDLKLITSRITVLKDDTVIFHGRPLTEETGWENEKTITCEGDLAMLNDSVLRPYTFTGSVSDYIRYLINDHNGQVGPDKQLTVRHITVTDPNETIVRSNSDYVPVMQEIMDKTVNSSLGGYLSTEYDPANNVIYLDYLVDSTNGTNQTLEVGRNIIDFQRSISSEALATALVPLGAKDNETGERLTIKSVNDGRDYIVDSAASAENGLIYATYVWDDVTQPANLLTKARAILTDLVRVIPRIELSAVDLTEVGVQIDAIGFFEYVTVVDTAHNVSGQYLITERTYNISAPENDTVTFGGEEQTISGQSARTKSELSTLGDTILNKAIDIIDYQTDLLKGGDGGYMVIGTGEDGHPNELYFMDTDSTATARSVLRLNKNGIGFSTTGINGPYTNAWTIDGALNASFITTGTMAGDRVRTGLIQSRTGNSYWNLDTGEFYNSALSQTLDNLQDQIDDAIETYTGAAVPTLSNYPANEWTTTEEKDRHIGDLYMVNSDGGDYDGFYYRFEKTGNTYQWRLLKDTEVTKALADAEEALRRVSVAETQIEQNSEAITLRATKTEAQGYANTAQANAISAAATDATNKANAAETAAKNYADAQITVSANQITSTVSQTYETKTDATSKLNTAKTYAEGQASAAEEAANDYTDGKLTDYSTTVQMNSAISQSASQISQSVAATYSTKTEAQNYAQAAVDDLSLNSPNLYIVKDSIPGYLVGPANEIHSPVHPYNERTSDWIKVSPGDVLQIQNWAVEDYDDSESGTLWRLWIGYCFYVDKDLTTKIGRRREKYSGKKETYLAHTDVLVPADANYILVSYRTYGGACQAKIEINSKPTGWSMAPEDFENVEERVTSAEAELVIQAGQISSKVSETDYNGNTIASKINQDATTVQINASKIDLQGAVQISDLASAAKAALVTNTTSKNQYYLSTSPSSATGGSWADTTPTWSSGKYVWVRIATTKTFASGTSTTTYSTAVYDKPLTDALAAAAAAQTTADGAASSASAAQTTANSAASAASAAQTTADSAATAASAAQATADKNVKATVSCYYRSTTNSTPTIGTSTSIGTADNTDNAWEYVLPKPKSGTYFYTCERYTYADDSVAFSTVRPLSNLTATSAWCSATNSTYIDGASIYTGSLTADKIAANTTFTQKLYASDLNITGGSVNITTNSATSNIIKLDYTTNSTLMYPQGFEVRNKDANENITGKAMYQGSALYFFDVSGDTETRRSDLSKEALFIRDANGQLSAYYGSFMQTGNANCDLLYSKNGMYGGGNGNNSYVFLQNASNVRTIYLNGTDGGMEVSNGVQSLSYTAGNQLLIQNGTNKYSALIWPDSNGAGRLVLGDGQGTKWRTSLTNDGLVFRDSNDNIIGEYSKIATLSTYTAADTSGTLSFGPADIRVAKWGSAGFIHLNLHLTNASAFASRTFYTICTLPTGSRPAYAISQMITNQQGNSACLLNIGTDGKVQLYRYFEAAAWSGSSWIRCVLPAWFV